MPSHIPVKNVCGVRHRPSAHFSPPSNPAHATAISTAMGRWTAMTSAGRRIRTAHAENAHTGAVNNAHVHHPVNCHAKIQPHGRDSAPGDVWKCIWMENSTATADQAPNTINARFMSLIVAWYEAGDWPVGARWSESCELHTVATGRLWAGSPGAARFLTGGGEVITMRP